METKLPDVKTATPMPQVKAPKGSKSSLNDLLSEFTPKFRDSKECFEKAMPELKKKFAELASEAMDTFYHEHLPHVGTDAQSNAYHIAHEKILELLKGKIPIGLGKPSDSWHQWRVIRQRIYEENKEEIIAAIGDDKDREIERLKEQISSMARYR